MVDELGTCFGLRTSLDDARAISISLDESIYGESLFILDTRPEQHTYHGSRGFSHTILERVVALIDLSIFSISRMRADICQYNQCFIDGAAPFETVCINQLKPPPLF
jgi:hypothetical protein